ncbi:MAG: tetratricopeptide repeat protein [Candidatus Coatesbacteria bacterium]|nr:MAG: tetratricopeptide repeat protein [Candidatus Coatesbacteria bacterium]
MKRAFAIIFVIAAVCSAGETSTFDLLNRAAVLFGDRDFRAAASAYEEVLLIEKDNEDALLGLAKCYDNLGEKQQALGYYERYQKSAGENVETAYEIARLNEELGYYSAAISAYEAIVKMDDRERDAWRKLADHYADSGNVKKEAGALEHLIDLGAGGPDERFRLAYIYEVDLKDVDKAIDEYERLLREDPRHVEGHRRVAELYLSTNQPVKAREHFEELSNLEPRGAESYIRLAEIRLADKDVRGAIADLERAIDVDERNGYALALLGTLYNKEEKYAKAEKTLEKAVDVGRDEAEVYSELGIARLNLGNDDGAEGAFKRALDKEPWLAPALENLGVLYYHAKRYDDAYSNLSKLVKLEKGNVRGQLYFGFTAAELGYDNEAIDALNVVIREEPSNVDARVTLAEVYIAREKFSAVRKVLTEIGTPEYRADEIYYYLGLSAEGLEDYQMAVDNFRRAINENRRFYEAYLGMGRSAEAAEDYTTAETAYADATSLEPSRIEAPLALGSLFERLGEYSDAIRYYERASAADDDRIEPYLGLGRCYLERKNFGAAGKALKKAVEIDDESFEAHFQLGRYYKAEDKRPEAINEFEEAVWLVPESIPARVELGYMYLLEERYVDAMPVLEKAVSLDSDNFDANTYLAVTYENLERYPDAVKYYKTSVRLEPENIAVKRGLGSCFRHARKFDEAVVVWEDVLELDPENAEAYEMLGDLYRIKGSDAKRWHNYDRELEYYETATDYYRDFLDIEPHAPEKAFIEQFIKGYEHYRLLRVEEREEFTFLTEW